MPEASRFLVCGIIEIISLEIKNQIPRGFLTVSKTKLLMLEVVKNFLKYLVWQ